MRLLHGSGLILTLACGAESDPFEHCPEANLESWTEVEGRFEVDLAYRSAIAPDTNFRAFVANASESDVKLAACQVDRENLLWRFATIWTDIPPRDELPARAAFPLGNHPTVVQGGMERCLDEACIDVEVLLRDIMPLYRHAISVEDYSVDQGAFRGFIVQTVGRWADGSALVQVNFDLAWDPALTP